MTIPIPWKLNKLAARLVGGELKARRKELGLSQREVAELTGFHRPVVARMENGKHYLSLKGVYRYALAIGVDPVWDVLSVMDDIPLLLGLEPPRGVKDGPGGVREERARHHRKEGEGGPPRRAADGSTGQGGRRPSARRPVPSQARGPGPVAPPEVEEEPGGASSLQGQGAGGEAENADPPVPLELKDGTLCSMEPVARTDRGTPVFFLDSVPEEVVPETMKRRGRGYPASRGPFAQWLAKQIPLNTCAIVHHKKVIQIFKLNKTGDLFKITARSIQLEDRKRLVEEGILRSS